MMPKATVSALALMCLLLLSLLHTEATRPMPSSTDVEDEVEFDNDSSGESCEGVGEEECLMRRTLVAHVDYIYTQGGTKKP